MQGHKGGGVNPSQHFEISKPFTYQAKKGWIYHVGNINKFQTDVILHPQINLISWTSAITAATKNSSVTKMLLQANDVLFPTQLSPKFSKCWFKVAVKIRSSQLISALTKRLSWHLSPWCLLPASHRHPPGLHLSSWLISHELMCLQDKHVIMAFEGIKWQE